MFYYNVNLIRKSRSEKDIINHNTAIIELYKTGLDIIFKPMINFAKENNLVFSFCVVKCKKSLNENEVEIAVKKVYKESQIMSIHDTPKSILGTLLEFGDVLEVNITRKEIIFKSCDNLKLKC